MCIKHVGIINKVAWNIRNYRYVGDVSSPSAYSGGITHTWMGETWLVDGEALAVMAVKISSNSPSRRSARTETSGSRDGVSRCGGSLEGFWRLRLLPVRF